MAANLVRRYTKFEAHHLLNLSFAQFHADRDVVTLERQLDRTKHAGGAPARAHRTPTSATVEEYRALGHRAGDAAPQRERRPVGASPRRWRRSDPATSSWSAAAAAASRCSNHEHRRGGGSRLVAVTPGRDVVRLGPPGLRRRRPGAPPPSICPTPFAPRNPAFRRQAADRLRRAKLRDDGGRTRRDERRRAELEDALAAHPLSRDPQREQKLRAAAARRALRARRAAHRAAGAGPQREPRPPVRPRAAGAGGVGLRRRLAAHRRRGAAGPPLHRDRPAARGGAARGPARRPAAARARRGRLVLHLRASRARRAAPDATGALADQDGRQAGPRDRAASARICGANEDDAGLPETRVPDPGFTPYVARLGGGRHARRRARRRRDDRRRLRPPREAVHRPAAPGRRRSPPTPRPRPRAREAADACHRGVVAASSVAGRDEP